MTDQFFMISRSNEQLQQELEYILLKPDCHSWWISKMQSGREDTLKKLYAIKFCFKLGKMPQKRMECFRLLLDHLAWIEHQFLSDIRDSWKARSLWGMMRGVLGVRKSEHQSWLATGQTVNKEYYVEVSTSPQLHLCHRLFYQDGHQDSPSPSL